MAAALADKGAGTLTKVKMETTFAALQMHCRAGRYGQVGPDSITAKQLRNYVAQRLGEVSTRTVENEVSHIRRALRGAGREELAREMTREALAIPPATRIGTGRVTDPGVLQRALEKADNEMRAVIQLERYLGLRQAEVIRCARSLPEWQRAIERGASSITVRTGTKGGRIRDVFIPAAYRGRVLEAVRAASEIMADGRKNMIASATLEGARQQIQHRFSALGLDGENSGHSLRRSFARDQFEHYRTDGLSQTDALARLSLDLGHGEGRGRWVWNNYLGTTYGS